MGAGHASLANQGSWPGLPRLTHFPGCWEQKQEPERKMRKLCPGWDHREHAAVASSSPARSGYSREASLRDSLCLQSAMFTRWSVSANIYGNTPGPIFKRWCVCWVRFSRVLQLLLPERGLHKTEQKNPTFHPLLQAEVLGKTWGNLAGSSQRAPSWWQGTGRGPHHPLKHRAPEWLESSPTATALH